jgi:ribonuclease D
MRPHPLSAFFFTFNFRFAPQRRFTWRVIDTDAKLADWLPRFKAAPWLALDTEADSLHAYPEKLCLIQISLPGADALIDPLAPLSLRPFWDALSSRELILHGADYDLRLLRRAWGFVPKSIFDTMLAARLLGFTEFSLTSLVNRLLGIHLEKGPQTADWARRPLTERMVAYALNDVRYLKPVADSLRAGLEAKGRLDWHQETCARLVKDCAQPRSPDLDQVWRLKGASKLDRRGLAVLRELWRWRDQEATAVNRPPYFLLKHETLVALAAAATHSRPIDPLLPPRFSQRRREDVLAAAQRALELPRSQWPDLNRPTSRQLTAGEKHRCEQLRQRRDRHATELGIDPSLIASRATLVALARDWARNSAGLMRWQFKLLDSQ